MGIWTDIAVKRYENRIREIYEEAQRDIEAKISDFGRRYKIKEEIHLRDVKEGRWTQQDFESWVRGQVFQGKEWKAKKEMIADVLFNANTIASKILNDQKGNVFSYGANHQAYELEHGAGVDFGFRLYDSATVVNLIKNDPQILPYYTPKRSKDIPWNMHNITRQMTLGIVQGERIDQIAARIARETSSSNMKSMTRAARTGMTSAQNAGRQQRLKEAQSKGIKVRRRWMATFDERTRWQHADLDGQVQPLETPFRIGGYSIMYPGDPTAHPSMVYNCRCTLVGVLDGFPIEYERRDNINGQIIKDMTYRDWEKAKGVQYSKSRLVPTREFNQVTIGACKTVEEINDLLNSAGLFKQITGTWKVRKNPDTKKFEWADAGECKADLSGIDLESAKSIAATYEQVFSKYPQLKGKIGAPNANPLGMEYNVYAWSYTSSNGVVEVNPARYKKWSDIVESYEKDVVSNWHPQGTTAESIVAHELGHSVDGLLAREGILGGVTSSGQYRYASSSMRSTVMKRAAKKDPNIAQYFDVWGNKDGMQYAINDNVSAYATENNKEWFAECFAEYITSANPRTVASEFGKELEKLLKKIT